MQLPPLTKSQKQIIFHLYKFRYLRIDQLQTLFNHKDPHRVKEWIKDLENKKYISIIKDPKDQTKPYIMCLSQQARHILKEDTDVDKNFLKWLYKEKSKSEEFINRNLFIVNSYLYFEKNKKKNSEINFFTKQDLKGYDYFPDPMPDAYIDIEEGNKNNRYFLDFFDDGIPDGNLRYRVRYYFKYWESGSWQKNTDNAPFPTILFIFENDRKKKHIYYYARPILENSFNEDIEIFLTTKDNLILNKGNTNIWQRVDVEDSS